MYQYIWRQCKLQVPWLYWIRLTCIQFLSCWTNPMKRLNHQCVLPSLHTFSLKHISKFTSTFSHYGFPKKCYSNSNVLSTFTLVLYFVAFLFFTALSLFFFLVCYTSTPLPVGGILFSVVFTPPFFFFFLNCWITDQMMGQETFRVQFIYIDVNICLISLLMVKNFYYQKICQTAWYLSTWISVWCFKTFTQVSFIWELPLPKQYFNDIYFYLSITFGCFSQYWCGGAIFILVSEHHNEETCPAVKQCVGSFDDNNGGLWHRWITYFRLLIHTHWNVSKVSMLALVLFLGILSETTKVWNLTRF